MKEEDFNTTRIQEILNDHQPLLDSEVREYLESFLLNAIDEGEAKEDVLSTVQEFLSFAECEAILSLFPNDDEKKQEASLEPRKVISPSFLDEQRDNMPPKGGKNEKETKAPISHKDKRKERRLQKRKERKAKVSPQEEASNLIDDHGSAWYACQEEGKLWGGRGFGGRGLRISGENMASIHLPSVSLQFEGNELLVDSPMDILQAHRYGLVGRNGVGKSTLLRQLAAGAVPGMPRNMRIIIVKQQIQGRTDQTTVEALVEADTDRLMLLKEQERVEKNLESGLDLEKNAERLGDIVSELDAINADTAEDRAMEILLGLSFTKEMIHGPTASLSGGWRMRLALAQALFVQHSDLILLDECTNHLDLHGLDWLVRYLTKSKHTLIVVSHDRSFLDAVCTDIVVMEHQRLSYHVGNYSEYQRQMQEKAARQAQILDASERQRAKALAFVQKHQQASKKSTDPNKQRQAKMIKEKKLDRIGNYREDGKRYKNFSLKQLSEDHVRVAEKVHVERDDPTLRLRFPNPSFPPGVSDHSPLIKMDNVSFGYDESFLFEDITLQLTRGSKVALVGKNGCGKTTLVRLINGEFDGVGKQKGELYRENLRIGHVSQYSVEELEVFHQMTVAQYAEKHLLSGKASSKIIAEASGNVRQYLGAFGLGGQHAHRTVGSLSGGERMRLCFATVLADEPHMLVLDESTNHVDLETLDSMSGALRAFQGPVLMVSHNQGFLSGFCNELWVLEDGKLEISHNDTESFDELFSQYRNHILSASTAKVRTEQRRAKAGMAKKAAKHKTNARSNTTLLA